MSSVPLPSTVVTSTTATADDSAGAAPVYASVACRLTFSVAPEAPHRDRVAQHEAHRLARGHDQGARDRGLAGLDHSVAVEVAHDVDAPPGTAGVGVCVALKLTLPALPDTYVWR